MLRPGYVCSFFRSLHSRFVFLVLIYIDSLSRSYAFAERIFLPVERSTFSLLCSSGLVLFSFLPRKGLVRDG